MIRVGLQFYFYSMGRPNLQFIRDFGNPAGQFSCKVKRCRHGGVLGSRESNTDVERVGEHNGEAKEKLFHLSAETVMKS